jgi:ABC-type sugar transport system ATPase subunit
VSGLSCSYGHLRALEDINLSVRSGELVALAGENGAGKTTLVRCIAGDIVPAAGEIYLAGRRVRPGTESPWSGRTWRCATTWTSPPTSCSARNPSG